MFNDYLIIDWYKSIHKRNKKEKSLSNQMPNPTIVNFSIIYRTPVKQRNGSNMKWEHATKNTREQHPIVKKQKWRWTFSVYIRNSVLLQCNSHVTRDNNNNTRKKIEIIKTIMLGAFLITRKVHEKLDRISHFDWSNKKKTRRTLLHLWHVFAFTYQPSSWNNR